MINLATVFSGIGAIEQTSFVRHNAREIDQLSAKIEESIALYKAQYAAQND